MSAAPTPLPDTSPIAIPSLPSGQLEKIVVVSAYLSRRPAVPAVVQTRHGGKPLREEMLLHLARDLQLAVQSLALRHLPSDRRGQTRHFLRQRRLRGRFRFDTVESGSDSASCELVGFDFVPCDQIGGEALLVPVVP